MTQLTFEALTGPIQACGIKFDLFVIESKEQLNNEFEKIAKDAGASGYALALDNERIILLNEDLPTTNLSVEQHLLEDLQREMRTRIEKEPTLSEVKRQQRMINKYANILEAIEALPEQTDNRLPELEVVSNVQEANC